MRRASLTFIALLCIPYLLNAQSDRGNQSYRYAYLLQKQSTLEFYSIDPRNAIAGFLFDIPKGTNPLLSKAVLSPDGKLVGLIWRKLSGISEIQIVNLVNKRIHSVGDYQFLDPEHNELIEDQLFSWSPDSKYFAFNAVDSDNLSKIFVYSASENSIVRVVNDDTMLYQFAWAADSATLAVSAGDCFAKCDFYLNAYNIVSGQRQMSTNLTSAINNITGEPQYAMCSITWAPDGRYIAYMANCDPTVFYGKELYVHDTIKSKTLKLTSFTSPPPDIQPEFYFQASYAPVWYDPQHLLVGIFSSRIKVGKETSQDTLQLLDYFWPKGQPVVLADVYASEWSINPINKNISYRTQKTDGSSYISIVQLNGQSLTTLWSSPGQGCTPEWSPDGAYLVYRTYQENWQLALCKKSFSSLIFVDSNSYQRTSFSLLGNKDNSMLYPLGWIFAAPLSAP